MPRRGNGAGQPEDQGWPADQLSDPKPVRRPVAKDHGHSQGRECREAERPDRKARGRRMKRYLGPLGCASVQGRPRLHPLTSPPAP